MYISLSGDVQTLNHLKLCFVTLVTEYYHNDPVGIFKTFQLKLYIFCKILSKLHVFGIIHRM